MSESILDRMKQAHSLMDRDEWTGGSYYNEEEQERLLQGAQPAMSVTDFENDPTVIKNYDLLTSYLADNQDAFTKLIDSDAGPAEMLRDDFMRITSVAGKASALADAPEEVKKAYRDLRSTWDEVELKGTKETLNAVKDYGIDILANFETIPAVASVLFGNVGGASAQASVRAGAKTALSKVLQKAAANPVKSTAAYTGAITGIQDLAVQDLEIEIGERKDGIDLGQAAIATTLGAGIGGALSYGIGKVTSKYATNRLNNDLNEGPQLSESKGLELYQEGLEGEWIPASGEAVIKAVNRLLDGPEGATVSYKDINKAADDFVEEVGGGTATKEEFKTIVTGALKSGATGEVIKNKIAFGIWKTATDLTGNMFGKSAGILTPYTKFSKTAKTLQTRLSHEFAESFGKTKERIGMDFSEAAAAITGGFNTKYLEIVEPLALNSIKGNVSDEVNDVLNKAIRGDMKGAPANIQKAAVEIRGLFKTIGDQLYSEGIIENKLDNYIPRMWNRKAIEADQERFDSLLVSSGEAADSIEARRISDSMLDIENQIDGGTGGQFFAAKRKFTFEDDSVFTDFLNTDLLDVVQNYNFQAGKALAKKKVLLASNEREFIKTWINPIVDEMKSAGKTLTKKEREQIRELYRSATGENMERYGAKMQTAADGYTLATRVALLPLATIGSLTEIFINIGKAGVLNGVKGFKEASELSFKKVTGDLHTELKNRHGLTANEAFRELKRFGIAMEQSQAQIGNRLAGDDLATEAMQNVSNKFFRMNFLDQWTKFVQTASFSSGKNLIRDNLEAIAAHGNQPPNARIETLIGELNELNIDYKKGVAWVNAGAKRSDGFYEEMLGGAARYTNSVILQPSAMSGLKPLLHSNPKTTIAFQLLGYPAAFTNTVLKGAAKAMTRDAKRNVPKLALAGLIMTETARMTNYWRSNGMSERDKTPAEARLSAIKRWGGNGLLFDNMQRARDAARYSGTVTGYATAPFGPLASDAVGIAYGKYYQTLGSKTPFFASGNVIVGPEKMREYRRALRKKDEELKGLIPDRKYNIRDAFNKGGEVTVPNASPEPDERINKYTGLPYNYEAGSAFMDDLDPKKVERQGFAVGSVVARKLSGFLAETIDEATDGILDTKTINRAAKDIEQRTGLTARKQKQEQVYDESYDPDYDDFGDIEAYQVDEFGGEEALEEYLAYSIKAFLREKDMNIKPYSEETLAIQRSDKPEAYGEEFQRSRGYTQEEIDDFSYQAELGEEVDPNQTLFDEVRAALQMIRYDSVEHISNLADPEKVIEAKQFDDIIGIFAKNDKYLPSNTITIEGKKKIISNYIANNLDNPDLMIALRSMRDNAPKTTMGKNIASPTDGLNEPAWWKETKDKTFDTSPEKSGDTQVGNTTATYIKAKKAFTGEGEGLDYGSGLGKGAKEIAFDSFEVNPKPNVTPDFTDSSVIADSSYDMITSLNVLNVVDKGTRDFIVKDIFRILKENGEAIITTRGSDIYGDAKSPVIGNRGPEQGSVITSSGTYQKGFKQKELEDYIKSQLGDSVTISKFKGGAAGVKITKVKPTLDVQDMRLRNLDDFLSSSTEKEPMYRGISDFGEKDFEVAFVSPREMGVHVGTRGQAQYIMAKSLNAGGAEDDFSIPMTGEMKVKASDMDRFFANEMARRDGPTMEDIDFEKATVEEIEYATSMDLPPSSRMPSVSMSKGFINVKNPLVFNTDAANWTAENLLTTSYEQLHSAIRKGLGKKQIPAKFQKRLDDLAEEALEFPTILNIYDTSEVMLDSSFRQLALTKKLQSVLEDMGFDSIKYLNQVEPSLVGEKSNASYILFRPEQYKSVNASRFDQTDKRMMFDEGGLAYKIKSGDTLTKIAREHGVTVKELAEYNQIEDANKISVDQEIKIKPKEGDIPPREGEKKPSRKPTVEEEESLSIFDNLKGIKKAINTQVFANFIDHFNPFQGDKTEKDYNPRVIEALKYAAQNALKDGRKNIDYGDYNLAESNVRAQVASPTQRKKDNLQARMLSGEITPTEEAAFSVGGATLVIEDGQVYATDVYDFSKIEERISAAIPDQYTKLRRLVGNMKFGNKFKSKIKLGSIGEFIE